MGGKASAPAPAAPAAVASPTEEIFNLPVKVALGRLTDGQKALVKSNGNGDLALPLKKILAMLPLGSVKLTFGEIRQAAPAGTFLDVASEDQTMVELPLPDILQRLSAAHLSRRPAQKTVEVPPEVGNVFGPRGEQLQQAGGDTAIRAKPAAAPVAAAPAPVVAPKPPAPAPLAPPAIKVAAPLPTVPKVAAPSLPKPPSAAPHSRTEPAPMISSASLPAPAPFVPPPSKPETNAPIPALKISAPGLPKPVPTMPAVTKPELGSATALPQISQTAAQTLPKQDSVIDGELLTVSLASLIEGWPQNIKDEISGSKLKDSSVGLPMERVEAGLKTGKLTFAWQEIAGWLKPNPFTSQLNADTNVDLPLKVVAPLFIAQHKPLKSQKKLAIDESIPDLFAGGKPGAAAETVIEAPAPKPALPALPSVPAPTAAPTGAPIPKAPSLPAPGLPKPAMPGLPKPGAAVVAAPVKEAETLSELFGQAEKMNWSPREIVQKANMLKGIAGSIVAMSDGLMVAGELPAPFKAETTAAFLPQIFGRMIQYAKELNLGDLSSMIVECDKAPLQITKAGQIYFAVIGKPGEPLPVSQIKMIATELAKQNK